MRRYPWHSLSIPEVIGHFTSNGEMGLDSHVAGIRLREYGKNEITKKATESFFSRLLRQFQSPIAYVLIFAGVAALWLGEGVDAGVIIAALLVNVVIGLIQEGRANNAFEKLSESEELHALVVRDGKRLEVLAEELVIGDIIIVSAGKQIPADVRLISASDLSINEAALTGEWIPVPKTIEVLGENIPPARRTNLAFRGTTVVTGRGKGIVVATGDETELGVIADELQVEERTKTPLEKNMEGIARFILILVFLSALLLLVFGVFRGEPFTEMLLVAIAISVSAIPEGLPAAVTASLAIGMERILKYGGLVKNLLAAEILGTTTYVLTDKTGTLTKGRMALVEYALLHERTKETDSSHVQELLRAGAYASDAVIDEEQGEGKVVHGRPIERAVVLSAMHAGIPPITEKQIVSIPFSSTRRFGGAVVETDDTQTFFMSGAPESLLKLSTSIFDGIRERNITKDDQEVFERYLREYTKNGLRVIAVAKKEFKDGGAQKVRTNVDNAITDVTFMGLLVFADQIREDVPEALERITDAGARVVMVTGDNPNTAAYIANEVGLTKDIEKAITGTDIDQMDDRELLHALREHKVFARVLPTQKLRLARVLRGAGEVVAMTGDGINDAPALQAATIGIAVGSGTDVAKEAADLVLLNNSFAIIVNAIEEGRRLRDNIKKIVTFLLSTNFSEVLLVAAALLAGLPLPILPTQILWANIVGEGFMNFAFAFEPADKKTMRRNPKDPEITNILSRHVLEFIFMAGLITGGLLLVLYFYLQSIGTPIEEIRTMMFIGISFDVFFLAFSMKSFSKPIWQINLFSNKYLIFSFFFSLFVLFLAISVPVFAGLLEIVPLTNLEIGLLAVLGVLNAVVIESSKWLLFRGRNAA
ncbi:MAG: cation-translocating P-type ATPase [Patescibacteria group bacterium UBA2103]